MASRELSPATCAATRLRALPLSPARTAEMTMRLDALVSAAQAARQASDLDAIKQALNAVWFAVHKAHDYATEAERETRQEALAQLENAA